jgi:hypothetical protein
MRIVLSILLFIFTLNKTYAQDIVMPGKDNSGYIVTLLKHVLSYHPDKNYQLKFYNANLPKLRVMELIEKNQGIDIIAGGATKAREDILLPIRFPLLKGLYGWRIPLISNERKNLFFNINSMTEFKKLIPGQLHSWSDTKILEGNGITVDKASNYQGLFTMLENQRFDYFPRSMIEVHWELENHKHHDIMIDPYSLIHYPSAYYFYINKNNKALATDILSGLESALVDGSFEKLFLQYYGNVITKVKSEGRKTFHLKNPLLSDKTPLERKDLWLDMETKP